MDSRYMIGRARRPLSLVVVVATLLVLAMSPATRSSAHALLSSADPTINASLPEAPALVSAGFTEPLERGFSRLEVYSPSGGRVDIGETTFNDGDRKRMSVEVGELEPAVYTVVWRTLSEVDGHTYVGSYTFTVLNPDGSAPQGGAFVFTGTTGAGGAPTGVDGVFKALGLLAGVLLAGGFIFTAWAGFPAGQRLTSGRTAEQRGLLRLLIAAALISIALAAVSEVYLLFEQANQLNGGVGVLDEVVLDTQFGRWVVYRVVILVTVLVLVTGLGWAQRGQATAGHKGLSEEWLGTLVATGGLLGVGYLLGLSLVSHGAAPVAGEFWGVLSDFLHLLFVAVWLGALAFMSLVWLSRRKRVSAAEWPRYSAEMLRRFSLLAASSVLLVLVTGITNAFIEFPSLPSITDTDYGVVFIVKMWLVAVLFGVGAVNAFILRPRVIASAEDPPGKAGAGMLQSRLTTVIRVELAVALAVFVTSGILTQLPTARVQAQEAANTTDLSDVQASAFIGDTEIGEGGNLSLLINPARVGPNRFEVDIRDAGGEVVEVLLELEHPTAGVSQVVLPAEGDGVFAAEGSFFGLDGPWNLLVVVRRVELDDVFREFQAQVLPATPPLPTADQEGGSFALPAPQLDWNTVGGLWIMAAGALLVLWREPLVKRSQSAAVPVMAGGAFSLFIGLALVAGGSSHSPPGANLENPIPLTDESAARGATLYAANCVQCHGVTGRGDGELASELKPPPANFFVHVPFHTDGTLFGWVSDGVPGTAMPAWRQELSEDQMWDLINYLRANYNEPPSSDPAEIRSP